MRDMLRYTKRFKRFAKLHTKLLALDAMIGMHEVKLRVVEQLQFLMCNGGQTDGHFLHTVIRGPSGCGKTTLARVLYELWSELKTVPGEFVVLQRSDLVGGYMGQTAVKTKKALMKHRGGCIFIDEFYSLVYGDDTYGKECVDVLNTFMSEESDTVVIVAGYKDEMQRVFAAQPGLCRRFAWTFTIPRYTASELFRIFTAQLKLHGWSLDEPSGEPSGEGVEDLFVRGYSLFEFAGGDTFNLCLKSKIEYAKRHWKEGGSKKLSVEDVRRAMAQHFTKKKYNSMYI